MSGNNLDSFTETDRFDDEKVMAAVELDQMMVSLEKEFRRDLVPKEIIMKVLKLTCEYYDGDWSGVLDIQPDIGVWTPYWWYDAVNGPMYPTNFFEFENVSDYPTWSKALKEERTLCIPLIDPMTPEEEEHYKRLSTDSVIAAPYYKGATGFIVVRNPKKYVGIMDLLKLVAYIASCEFHDYRLIENTKHQMMASCIKDEKDVCINLFGGLEIITAHGMIKSDEINSMQIAPIITFLSIHRKHAYPPREIAAQMYTNYEDADAFTNKIKYYIYHFRQHYSDLFNGIDLIETTQSGYRLSSKLNIKVDTEIFDKWYKTAMNATNKNDKIRILEKLFKLYKNDVYPPASMDSWLVATTMHYSDYFFRLTEELFRLLALREDYSAIHDYASTALKHHDNNERLYYWMIVSMIERDQHDLAKQEYRSAYKNLESKALQKLKNDLEEKYSIDSFDPGN